MHGTIAFNHLSYIPAVLLNFTIGGQTYLNNSEVQMSEIGEGEDALLCRTDSTNCCNSQTTLIGEFYYPDGRAVGVRVTGDSLYRNRGHRFIRLNRRHGATSPLGKYKCAIPDSAGMIRNIYINIIAGTAVLDIQFCIQ